MQVVGWFRRVVRRRPPARAGAPAVPTAGVLDRVADRPALTTLTTPQLCALWRKSRSALTGAAAPAAPAAVVDARGVLLDELERREPHAMAEWLRSGAGEPEGPSIYLVR